MSWLDTRPAADVERALQTLRSEEGQRAFARAIEYGGGDERFTLWLAMADQRVQRGTGVSAFDLADWTWRDAFDDGYSPADAAREAIAEGDL